MDLINASIILTPSRHDEDSDDSSSGILVAKAVTMVCLCTFSLCMGLLPLLLAKWMNWSATDITPRSAWTIKILLGFSGGVLLSTTFLHMLPEVKESVEELQESGEIGAIGVSLSELLMCSGFFLIYFVEELVHLYLRKNVERQEDLKANSVDKHTNKSTSELVENGHNTACAANPPRGYGHGHSHLPMIAQSDNSLANAVRGLLIVLGLSVHELFEGLAIGLQSTTSGVWTLFGGVAAHKFVIAFCIGVELISSRTKLYLMVIYIFTYSVVSPLGAGIGMILIGTGTATESGAVAVVLQGLATGTLLYVVFFEILRKEHGIQHWLSIVCGFFVMCGVEMATGHDHSHSHSH